MSLLDDLPPEALAELKALLEEKASDLFAICDREEKGFVTKRDMQRMRSELPLEPEQLEEAFDKLDVDKNGFLTLEEFTQGFGAYLGIETAAQVSTSTDERQESGEEEDKEEQLDVREPDEDDEFDALLSQLGMTDMVDDDKPLRDMWFALRQENDPSLVANFEQFLTKLSNDLNKKNSDQEMFENSIKTRNMIQEEHLQRLYEEMEQQIGAERLRIRAEEEKKEQKLREELEETLRLKDQQMVEVMDRMKSLRNELEEAQKSVPSVLEENAQLAKERDRLMNELERQRIFQKELQESMNALRSQTQSERKERAKAALKVSESIAKEREGIVNQLDFMKTLNAKMLDERDLQTNQSQEDENLSLEAEMAPMLIGSSEVGKSSASVQPKYLMPAVQSYADMAANSECEYDDEYFKNDQLPNLVIEEKKSKFLKPNFKRFHSHPSSHDVLRDNVSLHEELAGIEDSSGLGSSDVRNRDDEDDGYDDDDDDERVFSDQQGTPLVGQVRRGPRRRTRSALDANHNGHYSSSLVIMNLPPRRRQAESVTSYTNSIDADSDFTSLGCNGRFIAPLSEVKKENVVTLQQPERVFKVIFIGDSSVGKSSLITRFCKGKFQPGLKSTIGVDFHTKSFVVDGQSICLQCWDTAGQERYRAITNQYFRKADAVVVVYDITSEHSFLNARDWLNTAVEGAGKQATLMLLGNKLDLAQDDLLRKVRKSEGLKLSDQFADTLFDEVSASSGVNVEEALLQLAKVLRDKEDLEMQKALKLSLDAKDEKKKKNCCSGEKKAKK